MAARARPRRAARAPGRSAGGRRVDLRGRPRCALAQDAVQRRGPAALELGQPALADALGRAAGRRLSSVSAARRYRPVPPTTIGRRAGVQQRVDLGVGQLGVLAGAEASRRRAGTRSVGARAAPAPPASRRRSGSRAPGRPGARRPTPRPAARPARAQPLRELDRDVGLADAGRPEQGDHRRARHRPAVSWSDERSVEPESRPITIRSPPATEAARSAPTTLGGAPARPRGRVRERLASGRTRGDARGRPRGARPGGADRVRRRRGARLRARARVGDRGGGVGCLVGRRRRPSAVPHSRSTARSPRRQCCTGCRLAGSSGADAAVRPVLLPDRRGARDARADDARGAGARRTGERTDGRRRRARCSSATEVYEQRRGRRHARRRRAAAVRLAGRAPLGREVTITAAEGNVIHELAGRPALQTVREVIAELSPRDRALVAAGLLIGVVIDGGKPEYEQGDFLVRGVLGADPETGSLAIGASVEPGQVVRLHARDARSADEDLRRELRSCGSRRSPVSAGRRARVLLQRSRQRDVRSDRPRRHGRRRRARAAPQRPGSSPPARSARSAAAASCTASRRRSRCSRLAGLRLDCPPCSGATA